MKRTRFERQVEEFEIVIVDDGTDNTWISPGALRRLKDVSAERRETNMGIGAAIGRD